MSYPEGVTFWKGPEAQRYLDFRGAEAAYIPEAGQPGIVVLREGASRAAVIEELLHLGQHRRLGWRDPSKMINSLEVEAQLKLIKNARSYRLSPAEVEQTKTALDYWRSLIK